MSPEVTPRLSIDSLSAGYLGQPVVRDMSLTVGPGEVVALLGANGAGKTTTLITVAGLHAPISGSVRLDGAEISGRPTFRLAREGVSLVPENRSLFYDLTVREHLRLARKGDRAMETDELLAILPELEKCLDRKAGVLSGGEQQMVALGRAIVGRPCLLLVDEMSLGLAPVVVERLLPVLRRVADEMGAGILFVEQHVPLALQVADRACVLVRGRVVLSGGAAEMRERPELLRSSYLGDEAVEETAKSELIREERKQSAT